MGISIHSEVWEKKENKKHQKQIEELSEIHGINYISTPRPNRRGGGCAITCDARDYTMKRIHLDNPNNLEIAAAVIRPKAKETRNITIITIAVYCPPNSRKQSKLIIML